MSFRGRLRLFFALIVIVPMVALGVVLFALTAAARPARPTPASRPAAARPSASTASRRERAQPGCAGSRAIRELRSARSRSGRRIARASARLRELTVGDVVASGAVGRAASARRARTGSPRAVAFAGSELVVREARRRGALGVGHERVRASRIA